ncbi:hypothetical protein GCM10012288_24350 [Malaciobacter pacificus]|uniref:Uncharacterized protein n=1 Tax=Malaciobacter pacificus TaxID=1080223 RepID=A0A5C2HEF0_9BACT|nr:hypothetical protein [Malaciobacter pacificus]QEP35184.1 hypothetical protein APAC_2112 [Malaciobacter pacificus]GGD49390.1 hypothetical protein GCM10012288_24350 [Malaciobacter pacificus]
MRHTFEIDGVIINPELPENFDITPNDERSEEEINNWWDKPYILIDELEQESWEEHYHRLKSYDWSDEKIGSKEEWNKHLKGEKENWYKEYPDGFRYNLRCLDGGAWDRSTNHGFYATFDEAIKAAKELQTNTFYAVLDEMISQIDKIQFLSERYEKFDIDEDWDDKIDTILHLSINFLSIKDKINVDDYFNKDHIKVLSHIGEKFKKTGYAPLYMDEEDRPYYTEEQCPDWIIGYDIPKTFDIEMFRDVDKMGDYFLYTMKKGINKIKNPNEAAELEKEMERFRIGNGNLFLNPDIFRDVLEPDEVLNLDEVKTATNDLRELIKSENQTKDLEL